MTPLVYRRLFETFPETEPLFWRDTTGAVRGEMLAQALMQLLDLEGRIAANFLRAEQINHAGVEVSPETFGRFYPIVRDVCREIVGADWTPAMEAAWSGALARIEGLLGAGA